MDKIYDEIIINAPKEKVWNTMLNQDTYRKWTSAFTEGSHYKGSWEEGSKILFLDPNGNGMVSVIEESRPYDFISIKHIGIIKDGVEDTESKEAKKWAPAFENYTFTEENGKTKVSLDMDIDQEHKEDLKKMWSNALEKLKDLAQSN